MDRLGAFSLLLPPCTSPTPRPRMVPTRSPLPPRPSQPLLHLNPPMFTHLRIIRKNKFFLVKPITLKPDNSTPWIIVGDFNLMCQASDNNNNSLCPAEVGMFNNTVNTLANRKSLLYRHFTWFSNRSSYA